MFKGWRQSSPDPRFPATLRPASANPPVAAAPPLSAEDERFAAEMARSTDRFETARREFYRRRGLGTPEYDRFDFLSSAFFVNLGLFSDIEAALDEF